MKRLLQILMISSFTFASTLASAADAQGSLSNEKMVSKSGQNIKTGKRKSQSSKLDQMIIAESRAEGGSLSSQEALDELRESLGEK